MKKSTIKLIISGLPAVGKTTLAKSIAEKFGVKHYGGGDALKLVAIDEGYEPIGDDWWDKEDGMKFTEQRKNDPFFDEKVDKQLMKIISQGNAVITSYTLPWICDDGVKIWLNGSLENRAERMISRDNITIEEALKITNLRDSKNKELYKTIYDFDLSDLSVFDFVMNTDLLSKEDLKKVVFKILEHLK